MNAAGKLVIAGGNVFNSKAEVYGKFIELAGGADKAHIAVIAAASSRPLLSFADAKEIMSALGVDEKNIVCVPISFDKDALEAGWVDNGDAALLSYFESATGVWITGGDQLRIMNSLYKDDGTDTPVLARIREMLRDGLVVGGTSAGAAVMSEIMIARGTDTGALNGAVSLAPFGFLEDEEEEDEALYVARGLGFIKECIVDQHFNKRARLWRLIKAMEAMGVARGYGISEDTAMIVDGSSNGFEVCGSASVYEVSLNGAEVIIKEHKAS